MIQDDQQEEQIAWKKTPSRQFDRAIVRIGIDRGIKLYRQLFHPRYRAGPFEQIVDPVSGNAILADRGADNATNNRSS